MSTDRTRRAPRIPSTIVRTTVCAYCSGIGRHESAPCSHCNGKGVQSIKKSENGFFIRILCLLLSLFIVVLIYVVFSQISMQ